MRQLLKMQVFMFALSFSTQSLASDANDIEKKLSDFAKECSTLKFSKVLVERTQDNQTDTTLVDRVKKRLSNNIPEFSSFQDQEIFSDRTRVGLQSEDFQGTIVRNVGCSQMIKSFNRSFDVFGVMAKTPQGHQAYGYVLQTRLGNLSYQFYVLSQLKFYKPVIMHNDWFFEDVVDQTMKTIEISDQDLVEVAKGGDLSTVPARIESLFVEARQALIDHSEVYGQALFDGKYLNDPLTRWIYTKGKHPETGENLEIIYFDEMDDGSYSMYFNPVTSELVYLIYEN